jgi:outer membrane protein
MMQTTIRTASRLIPAALLMAGCIGSAWADDAATPVNEVRLGAYFVHYATTAQDLSGPFTPAGINIRVGNLSTPYLAYLRSFGAPKTHTYGSGPATVGSVPFNGQEVATANWFSPSLLLDYKFLEPSAALRPFVGAGINYTRFYKLDSTPAGDAANGGPTQVSLSSSWGPAATIGASYRITREIDVVASYSAARVDSHYASDTSGDVRTTTIHFNPRTWVVALGYSF